MLSVQEKSAVVRSLIAALIMHGASRATKFISENETVTAKRVMYRGRIDKRARRQTAVVSFGRPNHAERLFIRRCKKAGEPFPVKKIQLKFPTR